MKTVYKNNITMDPSGFVLLADFVPHIVQEIRYYSEVSHPDHRGVTEEQYANRMLLQRVMVRNGFRPIDCEWWHFCLENEPYPDTYFTFPVSSAYLKR